MARGLLPCVHVEPPTERRDSTDEERNKRAAGTAKELHGDDKKTVGKLVGSKRLEAEGRARELAGRDKKKPQDRERAKGAVEEVTGRIQSAAGDLIDDREIARARTISPGEGQGAPGCEPLASRRLAARPSHGIQVDEEIAVRCVGACRGGCSARGSTAPARRTAPRVPQHRPQPSRPGPEGRNAHRPVEHAQDIDLTPEIRSGITSIDAMSIQARNVKVISQDGVVTLRGPVES